MSVKITTEDLEACWQYRDTYLCQLLNGEYTIEQAREDILSLIGSKYDKREGVE